VGECHVGGGSVWAYRGRLSRWAVHCVGDVSIWEYCGPLGHWVAHCVGGGLIWVYHHPLGGGGVWRICHLGVGLV